jgi:NAD(P)-dependent dehydrogenase (short-subunit alcohol dehydrogenase family)
MIDNATELPAADSMRWPDQRLAGRVAVITGGGQGIGAAIAGRFAEQGAVVVAVDIDGDRAAQTADRIGPGAVGIAADVAREEDVSRAVSETLNRCEGIDVLVNCAGIAGPQVPVGDTSVEDWDRTQAVNLRGTFLMIKHCLPSLIQRRGNIVNVASALALVGWRNESAYGPSKAGVVQLTKSVALDYAAAIRSNCVCPGAVRTPMITAVLEGRPDMEQALTEYGTIHPLWGRLAWPAEIADAVLFLASDDASFITGVALPVDAGFTAT